MTDENDASLPVIVGRQPLLSAAQIDQNRMAKLALELVMNMRERAVVLKDYSLTEDEFAANIAPNPFFQRVLDAYTIEWNGALSTEQRLKIQAAVAMEFGMPVIAARMNDPEETLTAAVEAAKLLIKIAGVGEQKGGGSSGEKITISINLGADQQLKFEKDITPTPPATGGPSEISEIVKGAVNPAKIQSLAST